MSLSLNGINPYSRNVQLSAEKPGSPIQPLVNATPSVTTQQQREQAQIGQLQSQYAGLGSSPPFTGNPNQKANDVLASVRSERYAHIVGHEQAHAAAAGSLAGGMVIDYDQNGVAFAGHVPIHIPGLDKNSPDTSMKAFQTVRFAALAPSDPSGQDMAVASQAQSLMGQAQVLIAKKKQAGRHQSGP